MPTTPGSRDLVHRLMTPGIDVDADDVRRYLHLRLEENVNVEYKQRVNDSTVKSIAAMANSYGGVVILGVADPDPTSTDPLSVVGVPPDAADRLTAKCRSKLEPPWVPEMVTIDLDDGTVLLVRASADDAPRPVVMDGRVHVRHGTHDVAAKRERIQSLFREPTARPLTDDLLTGTAPHFGQLSWVDSSQPAIAVRFEMLVRLPPRAPKVMTKAARDAFEAALARCRLVEWGNAFLFREAGAGDVSWSRAWPSTSAQVTHQYSAEPVDPEGRCPLALRAACNLPTPPRHARGLRVQVDVVASPNRTPEFSGEGNAGRASALDLEGLYWLLRAGLVSIAETIEPAVVRPLLGLDVWESAGPAVHLETVEATFEEVVTVPALPRVQWGSGTAGPLGTYPATSRGPDDADWDDRVRTILTTVLLDRGYVNPEALVGGL